ncbi:MAG: hypothetical protein CMF89_02250 [Candidatus Marinimicrobia bacterium]|nr:hypothetical protein [Candidatus Neomarinimicrobiota bacterium]
MNILYKKYIYNFLQFIIIFQFCFGIVTYEMAEKVAKNILIENNKSNYIIDSYFLDSKNKVDNFYIFQFYPKGFVLVSANKNSIPIIGYSFNNNLEFDDLPPQLGAIIESYRKNIQSIINNNTRPAQFVEDLWTKYLSEENLNRHIRDVSPLISANWNQGGQWNNQCPGETLVGCVAVAMGQVMYYWENPIQPIGYAQYYDEQFGPIGVIFDNFSYNYDNMLDNQATEDSQRLLYHAGVAVNMDYSYSGSGASVCWEGPSAQDALSSHFNFIDEAGCESKLNYNDDEWSILIKEQIDNGWPIIYRGYEENDGGGHAWNIDGYQDQYLHCNWGWGGSSNGYFYFNNLNGEGFSFIESQAALINIFPRGIAVPIALFDYSINDFTVIFTNISNQINENNIAEYKWNFGDGFTSNELNPIHSFQDFGSYEVSLIVTDEYGQDSVPHIEFINIIYGDINNDNSLNIIDIVLLVDMVFSNVENSDYDLNQDQVLTILDIIILVNLVLEFNNEY